MKVITDYAPRMRSLNNQRLRNNLKNKSILIAFILLIAIGAVIKKATAEPTLQPIDCSSLVDQNGEE